MNLAQISNQNLLEKTRRLALEERRITNEILHHLNEIESRRLYLELGYTSLFLYVTKELRYSEAAAQRRIDAARLLRQVPVIETKIASGELTLGSVGKAQQYFRAERKSGNVLSPEQKEEVVLALSGLSTREAESKLAEKNPDAFPREKIRALPENELQITFTANAELKTKLQRVRDQKTERGEAAALPQRRNGASRPNEAPVAARLDREVRQRDRNRCTWKLADGRVCESRWKVQVDHVVPRALGGPNTLENLRCLCREHNLPAAERVFGRKKIAKFRWR